MTHKKKVLGRTEVARVQETRHMRLQRVTDSEIMLYHVESKSLKNAGTRVSQTKTSKTHPRERAMNMTEIAIRGALPTKVKLILRKTLQEKSCGNLVHPFKTSNPLETARLRTRPRKSSLKDKCSRSSVPSLQNN